MIKDRSINFIGTIVFCFISIILILKNEVAYSQCAVTENFTSSPLPVNNTYPTGTTVTFCYTLVGFSQSGSNWVDGFIIDFGNGWDANSLTAVSEPNSCYGWGEWGFELSDTSSGSGGIFGPGFYFDVYDVATGLLDGNPGNDFGDYSPTGTCQWNLCFSLTVNPTCTNSDLSVSITAAGDGLVGSWISNDCPGIPFPLSTASCVANCNGFNVTATGIDPGCIGNNGSITTQVNGGLAPYTYQWSNSGGTNSSINNLSIGTYNVSVSDINGCLAIDSATLILPSPISLTSVVSNATCLSYCDGAISLSPLGGQLPYNFSWSSGVSPIQNPTNLCAGTYYVTVSDQNFCTIIDTNTVTEPFGMNISMSSTSTTCNGGCDGTMTASITLGTPPYNLIWFNNTTNNTVSGLCGGVYNVSVTDANGCTLLGSSSVNQPSAIVINTFPHHVSCKGLTDGWITFNQMNAVMPYTTLWMPGAFPFDTLKNIGAGNYTVTLTDFKGCTGSSIVTVNEPLELSLSMNTTLTSCPLSSDGNIIAIPSGGTPQYFYNWLNPAGEISSSINDLPVGYYDVILTDANGCTAYSGDSILSNDLFSVNAFGDTTIVNENEATIGVQLSQTGSFNYLWSPDEFISTPNLSGTIVSPTITTTYTIVVIESGSNCTNYDSVVITVLPTTYIFIPNAFTPNNDGINDMFQLIKGEIVNIYSVKIYNRWGEIVYEQAELNWDGKNRDEKLCGFGVYAYIIEYKLEGDNLTYRKQGNVTLVR